ncbi:MAG: MBL fold metallo-hydrolase [Lachnospiraceae bacterium]|nr:MBL fold metallo-hydrolase [Lachnospiraceae bacterium]
MKKKTIKLIALMLIFCLIFTGCNETDTGEGQGGKVTGTVQNHDDSEPGTLKVYCFELGKADSFLIYNNKATIIIDAGERGQGKDILQYMENNDINGIDMMFITHFDKDHVGGAAKLIGNTEVKEVYTPSYVKPSDDYDNFSEKVKEKKTPVTALKENTSFEAGGIKIDVNVAAKEVYEESPSNNSSLIIRVSYGDTSFLFTGDAEGIRLREYIATNPEKCNVVKMPYHGKYTEFMGCLDEFLDLVQPEYAVITSSKEEKEADETKDLIEKRGIKLFRTRKGSVLFESDGKEVKAVQMS